MSELYYIGTLSENTEQGNAGSLVKSAELFAVGTHRGIEYTQEDIQELERTFSPSEDIPVQVDHSNSAKDTVGYLQEVSEKDGKLLGKLSIIDEKAKEKVQQGLMKKLSIGFFLKMTDEGLKPYKLREVSLVAFPQVKSARLLNERGYVSDSQDELAEFEKRLSTLERQNGETVGECKNQLTEDEQELERIFEEHVQQYGINL